MVKRIFKILIALFILINSTTACAKEGYHIEVQVKGVSDTLCYLAYHFGNRQYLLDSVDVDGEGRFTFAGEESLPGGMYMIVLPGQKYFELIIDESQHFEIETVMDEFVETIKFKGSPENSSFYEYIRYLRKKNQEVAPIREELNDPSISEERRETLREKSRFIDSQVDKKREAYIEKFPDCVFSLILRSQREVPPPEPVISEDGTTDYGASYRKHTKNYWQHIDFTDDRILRTPVYHSKLDHFFTNVVIKHPDSIINMADYIVDQVRENDEMFEYTVWFITNKYERSNIMGLDAVFVHMVEEYYKTGKAFWLDEEQLERIIRRSDRLKPILLGKTAPDIKMYLPDKSTISLHEVPATYTVIYFWDSDCPHCKRETPKLNDFYQRYKDHGIEIFAVNIEPDRERWISYVEKNNIEDWINVNDAMNRSGFRDKYDIYSIPLIFLIDEDKKIIAKNVDAEQVEDIISRKLQKNLLPAFE